MDLTLAALILSGLLALIGIVAIVATMAKHERHYKQLEDNFRKLKQDEPTVSRLD